MTDPLTPNFPDQATRLRADIPRLLCPECRLPLTPATLACANGHAYAWRDGVLVLLSVEFGRYLRAFLDAFSRLREAHQARLMDVAAYPLLPYGPAVSADFRWDIRRADLALVPRLLPSARPLRILEVGAWNGWLTHHLARAGHQVTAVDYFDDEYDGLRAHKHYAESWTAIQMNLEELSLLASPFDAIILNHCLAFFTHPPATVAQAQALLAPAGRLLIIGLSFFRRPAFKRAQVAADRAQRQAAGVKELKEMRGYLDWQDRVWLTRQGVRLRAYGALWRANLKARLRPTAPYYAYGLYQAPAAQL